MITTYGVIVKFQDVMGDDLSPILAAKVSFDNDDFDKETDNLVWQWTDLPCISREQPLLTEKQERLLQFLARGMDHKEFEALVDQVRYLGGNFDEGNEAAREKIKELLWKFRDTPTHAAPFGHCFASFVIEAPVFVARQLVKHEYLRMSEVSRRYVKSEPVYYTPKVWSSIAESVKQGSGKPLPLALQDDAEATHHDAVRASHEAYEALLKFVSPEEARMVLPLCHMTRWWWSGSLDAFANMCNLRLDSHAQSLTRDVAQKISYHLKEAFPSSWKALVRKC